MIFGKKEAEDPQKASSAIQVTSQESGQKLMGFLERRLLLPPTLLHRWIRTGQVRLNGSRTQPFVRLATGDSVRIPPFAGALSKQAKAAREKQESRKPPVLSQRAATRPQEPQAAQPGRLEVLARDDEYMAIFKPAGLPTQPGTGHVDAVTTRLRHMEPDAPFAPTPVHRLDRDTSGILLVARTFQALRKAHEALQLRHGIHKEYLVWVHGVWPHDRDILLRHYMKKGQVGNQERMLVSSEPNQGQEALLVARVIQRTELHSLLLVRLLTGRTHQIRAQLAHVGYPVVGDGKYGTQGAKDGHLMLHATRLCLPDGRVFTSLPRWQAPFAVESLPDAIETIPR